MIKKGQRRVPFAKQKQTYKNRNKSIEWLSTGSSPRRKNETCKYCTITIQLIFLSV